MKRKMSQRLLDWKSSDDRKSLLLRGARQVGKTYCLLDFARTEYENYVLIDFIKNPSAKSIFADSLDVDSIILRISARYPDKKLEPYKTVLIFDEIQECTPAYSSLTSFSEDPRYDVMASGSLLGLKLNDMNDVPVGQINRMDMYPMDFEEFLWAIGVNDDVIRKIKECISEERPLGESLHKSLSEYQNWYMLVGGMPEAVSTFIKKKTFEKVRSIQRDIIEDYKEDIGKHCKDSERLKTERCFDSLSMHLAKDNKRFVISNVERDLGYRASSERYEYALNWLLKAGIALECIRVADVCLPTEESAIGRINEWNIDEEGTVGEYLFKLYVVDTGLLACQYDPSIYSEIISGNIKVNKGALAENLVACQLKSQDRKLMYYEKTREMEVDFILSIDGKPTVVEVKSGRNRSCRSLNKAMQHFDAEGIMFDTLDIFTDDKGVRHYPIYAAAFMDCVDSKRLTKVDFDSVTKLNDQTGRKN